MLETGPSCPRPSVKTKEVAEDLHELGKISGTGRTDVQLLWPAKLASRKAVKVVFAPRATPAMVQVLASNAVFPGGASGFCPVALASELRRNMQ